MKIVIYIFFLVLTLAKILYQHTHKKQRRWFVAHAHFDCVLWSPKCVGQKKNTRNSIYGRHRVRELANLGNETEEYGTALRLPLSFLSYPHHINMTVRYTHTVGWHALRIYKQASNMCLCVNTVNIFRLFYTHTCICIYRMRVNATGREKKG